MMKQRKNKILLDHNYFAKVRASLHIIERVLQHKKRSGKICENINQMKFAQTNLPHPVNSYDIKTIPYQLTAQLSLLYATNR